MDALLPSEIARLVLGYLQEQKCDEAAKIFMETSPLLKECRIVSQRGGRYTTKVGGFSLVDILDKYCAAVGMVQEKLNKMNDLEQFKHCDDILEKLGYLLEGSKKRFVVNINYSSQNSSAGLHSSPNTSSSTKKRLSGGQGRRKGIPKSLSAFLIDKSSQIEGNQDCDVRETVSHEFECQKLSTERNNTENKRFSNDQLLNDVNVNNVEENRASKSLSVNSDGNIEVSSSNTVNINHKDQATETIQTNDYEKNVNKCTAGTSTEELMSYCNTEVQTGLDFNEMESEVTEPIENLSIITQELMNRTELQQRIAENINNAILPMELSFNGDNANLSLTDLNKSKLCDLDNVIKTAVEATELDLEGFIQEIFDVKDQNPPIGEIPVTRDDPVSEPMDIDIQDTANLMQNYHQQFNNFEIPIKQRLRSSSKSYNVHGEEEENNALLDNQNAEAVMNIMNVINYKRNSLTDSEPPFEENDIETNEGEAAKENVVIENAPAEPKITKNATKTTKSNKTIAKKPKQRTKKSSKIESKKELVVEEIVPTVVLYTEPLKPKRKYVSIAPKEGQPPPQLELAELPTLSYRVVNVPRRLVKPEQIELSKMSNTLVQKTLQEYQPICPKPSNDVPVMPIGVQIDEQLEPPPPTSDSITLYGAQESNNTPATMIQSIEDMPIISLDSSPMSGLRFSSAFKGETVPTSAKTETVGIIVLEGENSTEQSKDKKSVITEDKVAEITEENTDLGKSVIVSDEPEPVVQSDASAKLKCDEIIAKRTPNTLLRSRSENNRLSLSTPRRRNSHVRALDFGTPVKQTLIANKGSQSCIKPSVCRGALFKSPVYETEDAPAMAQLHVATKKVRTLAPTKSSTRVALMQVPIATRSPMQKLRGNWNKVAGIGMILNESSTGESSPEKSQPDYPAPPSPALASKSAEVKVESNGLHKSWDSDLRRIVGSSADEEEEEKIKSNGKSQRQKRNLSVKVTSKDQFEEKKVPEKDSENSDSVKKKDLKHDVITSINLKKKDNVTKYMLESVDTENNKLKDETEGVSSVTKKEKSVDQKVGTPSALKCKVLTNSNLNVTPLQSVKKSEQNSIHYDSSINKTLISKNSLDSLCIASQLLDLETPRKTEVTNYIPPTPQVFATPAQSLRKSAGAKIDITIKGSVETPEFPVTPCIVVTPKFIEEDTKKHSSPYFEPSEEIMKEVAETQKMMVQETTSTISVRKSVVELPEHKAIEITQFGVVERNKETLKEEEQATEDTTLESKDTSNDMSNDTSKGTSKESAEAEDANTSVNSYSDSDNESSSDSSCSSSSSSSSSTTSSSSSSLSSGDSSVVKSEIFDTRDGLKESVLDISKGSPSKSIQILTEINHEETSNLEENNSSPKKVFSVMKHSEEKTDQETPAKDEIAEAVIFETPSVSEAERAQRRDSITNLNSKISAEIALSASPSQSTAEPPATNKILNVVKPKIIKIERIAPTDGMAIQVSKVLQSQETLVSTLARHQQVSLSADTILGQQLEQKRLRVLAKFKEVGNAKVAAQPRRLSHEKKQRKAIATVMNGIDEQEKVSSTSDNLKSERNSCEQKPSEGKIMGKKEDSVEKKEEKSIIKKEVKTVMKKEEKVVSREEKTMVTRSVKATQKANEADSKENQRVVCRSSPRKKSYQISNPTDNNQVKNNINQDSSKKNSKKENVIKESIVIPAENFKGISKAKVDLVKRDLFSDDENSEQRTTRSQSTRLSVTLSESQRSNEENSNNDNSKLLECLQLIPANKSDVEIHDLSEEIEEEMFNTSGRNKLDIMLKYDESIPIKKRRRNYSSSELQSEYIFQSDGDDYVLNLMPLEEIFNLDPPSKSKKTVQSSKKSLAKTSKKNSKNFEVPLATSSPLKTSTSNKTSEDKKTKSCKRKTVDMSEDEKVDSKTKPDPLFLLKKVKIDEFLKSVHVKEK